MNSRAESTNLAYEQGRNFQTMGNFQDSILDKAQDKPQY